MARDETGIAISVTTGNVLRNILQGQDLLHSQGELTGNVPAAMTPSWSHVHAVILGAE